MSQAVRFEVDEGAAGRRLDELLAARLERVSRMRIARLLAEGACAVNGAAAHAGHRVRRGDVVEVAPGADVPNATTPEPLPLEILHEDEDLLVVVKPAGMLVHPTRGVKAGTLANALSYHLNRLRIAEFGLRIDESTAVSNPQSAFRNPQSVVRPGLVHRLDRATSGLMVVAKRQRALSILARHFHQRLVEKRYLALVGGRVREDERVIVAPVGRDEESKPMWKVLEGGKHAETRLRVVERWTGRTLVELEPVTGRTNQLRIHCAHAGHAIVGDEWYGGEPAPRLCLHASRLAFNHPSGGARMEFNSPLPDEITRILDARA